MKNETKARIINIGRMVARVIRRDIERGLILPNGPDVKPNRANVKAMARKRAVWAWPDRDEIRNMLKTKPQYELFDRYVYQRLRRDGALKALRELTA